MQPFTLPPLISSLVFCCTAAVSVAAMAQTAAPDEAPAMATIISPIDTTSLKGRMVSAEKAVQAQTAAQLAAEAASPAPRPAKVKAKAKALKTPAAAKPQAHTGKRTTRPAATAATSQAPLVSRGDQFSYRHRGLLKAQAEGENRYGGHTFALPPETLTLDYADALAGFMSFDNLGTLREKKVYRANGSAEVSTYDPRSGDIIETKTEAVDNTDGLTAGGIGVMPGTRFDGLAAQGRSPAK